LLNARGVPPVICIKHQHTQNAHSVINLSICRGVAPNSAAFNYQPLIHFHPLPPHAHQ
jgi:hypothetical protein